MSIQRTKLPALLLALILFTTGCVDLVVPTASGNVIREERTVDAFTEISVCCGMRLELTQGDQPTVAIEADETLLPEIETTVRGEQLTVQLRSSFSLMPRLRSGRVTVYVTTPNVRALDLSGGSNGTMERLQGEDLHIDLSGGSHLTIDTVTAAHLTAELSGGAQVQVDAGTITEQQVDVSGGGQYRLENVQSDSIVVDLSGGSRAEVWARETLRVDASGGSNLTYRGAPVMEQDISGGSRVRAVGE